MLKMRCFVFEKLIKIFFYIYKYSYIFFYILQTTKIPKKRTKGKRIKIRTIVNYFCTIFKTEFV